MALKVCYNMSSLNEGKDLKNHTHTFQYKGTIVAIIYLQFQTSKTLFK